MLLPVRAKNPPESAPIGTVMLLVANLAIYAMTSTSRGVRPEVVQEWGLRSAQFDARHAIGALFIHGDLIHLLGNMWFLYLFGFVVEGRLRTLPYLFVYFGSGFVGELLYHAIVGRLNPQVPAIGASGAIMGVLGAAMWMFPFARIDMFYFLSFRRIGTLNWPMWGVGAWYLTYDLAYGLLGAPTGVGHFAHLGGALGGLILAAGCFPKRDSRLVSDAKATISENEDLTLLSPRELAELNELDPQNQDVVMEWMRRCVADPRGIDPIGQGIFVQNIHRLIAERDPVEVAQLLAALRDADLRSDWLMRLAPALERVGEVQMAANQYAMVLRLPQASDIDQEMAAYRTGLMAEETFDQPVVAQQWYAYVAERWPLGPLSADAEARLRRMKRDQVA